MQVNEPLFSIRTSLDTFCLIWANFDKPRSIWSASQYALIFISDKFRHVLTRINLKFNNIYRASQCAITLNFFTSGRALFKAFLLIDFVGAFLINCQIIEMRNFLLTLVSADASPVTILKNLKIKILLFKFSKESWMNHRVFTNFLMTSVQMFIRININ